MSAMKRALAERAVDLSNCAEEPIHVPGAIQPHGVLLAVDGEWVIRQVSANAGEHLDRPAEELLGSRLDGALLGEAAAAALAEGLETGQLEDVNPLPVVHAGRSFDGVAHHSGGLLVIELEPVPPGTRPVHTWAIASQRALARFQTLGGLRELLDVAVAEVRALTGFDRVMAYRFHADQSGEVVAEARREDLHPYLGLHYPESDIPAQARRLYTLNLLRLIADVGYRPQPIVPADNPLTGGPLDLSHAVLRSVSPIHVEYLTNMGVAASMSISLVVNGELWGLIACHHTRAKLVPYPVRMGCQLIGRTLALLIERLESEEAARQRREMNRLALDLQQKIGRSEDLLQALTQGTPTLLDYVDAGGAAATLDSRVATIGETPDRAFVARLVDWLRHHGVTASYATHRLPAEFAAAGEWADRASGLLAIPFYAERGGWALWFRPEVVRTMRWGGDPTGRDKVGKHGVRLTPRGSYAEWQETVRRTSAPWSAVEVEEAEDLRGDLAAAGLRKAEELERERELFLGMLGHDLRAPLQAISMSAELLRDGGGQGESSELSSSISRSSRRMARLIDHLLDFNRIASGVGLGLSRSRVELRGLVAKIVRENELAYPGVSIEVEAVGETSADCDPDRVEQVVANLLSNARHHGRVGTPVEVRLAGRGDEVEIAVANQGDPIPEELRGRLFTPYAGVAGERRRSGGLGLGLYITHSIVSGHDGRIEVESDAERGTVFRVYLPRSAAPSAEP